MTTAKWNKKSVTLATRGGDTIIQAHVYGALAVHRRVSDGKPLRSGGYVITHVTSGLALTGYRTMDCLDGAKACVEHLATLDIDWTKDQAGLLRDHKAVMKTVPREIDRFRDYGLRRTFRI